MRREPAAVLFDLDDTLYPYRRFLASGFRDLAGHLEAAYGCDRTATFRLLVRASRGPARGHENQIGLAAVQLPAQLAGPLTARLRDHQPSLRLPPVSIVTLAQLRARGWRIGILTNGDPAVQARKCAALGVDRYVDATVFASAHGSGQGKPDVEPFLHLCDTLQVAPTQCVMVGDSEECDVAGALAAGLAAIRCVAWTRPATVTTRAAHVVDCLTRVPALLSAVKDRVHRHVA